MNPPKFSLLLFAAAGGFLGTPHMAANAGDAAATVRRALPFLETEGVAWMEQRGCVSCHQVPFMLWSLSAAQQAGFDVDPDKLAQWRRWSTDVVNFVKPEQQEEVDREKTMAGNIDTMSALLLAVDDDVTTAWRVSFADGLAKNQQANGSWKSCGQLPAQKRPGRETGGVTTAWSLLALQSQNFEAFDAEAAMEVVDAVTAPESTEWWTVRLLLAKRGGTDRVQSLRQELLQRQNDDGGWGWLTADNSDALATGMAMYALSVTGSTDNQSGDGALAKATRFLVDTQQEVGSWAVPGTKKSTQTRTTPTANYWGTAWAVIGLLEMELDRT